MADQVDAAVAAASVPPPPAQIRVTLHTGRAVVLVVPVDLSPMEALDLVGYIARQLPARLAEARSPRGRLVVASSVPQA